MVVLKRFMMQQYDIALQRLIVGVNKYFYDTMSNVTL